MAEFADIVEARAGRRKRLAAEVGDIVALIELVEELDADAEPDERAVAAAQVAPTSTLANEVEEASNRMDEARTKLDDDKRALADAEAEEAEIAEQRRRRGSLNQQLGVLRIDLADAQASEARARKRTLIFRGIVLAIAAVAILVLVIVASGRH